MNKKKKKSCVYFIIDFDKINDKCLFYATVLIFQLFN